MNARHESFEPSSVTTGGGSELARWAQTHAMDFIGQPGVPTHRAGHVIDLTFSNIPSLLVGAVYTSHAVASSQEISVN